METQPIYQIALVLLVLLLVGCQPKTVIVQPGRNAPEQKWGEPIYVTATPVIRGGDWAYEDALNKAGIVRFTDRVDGQTIVCYYTQHNSRLECLALCKQQD